jgi:tetratricopeptide (TPR) repeat protein
MAAYQVTRGLVASALHDWPVAADALGRAARTDDLPQSWLGLAQARIELGAPADEIASDIERALRIAKQQPAIGYAAGALYDRLGMTAEADEAYVEAIVAFPSLAGDPSWTEDPVLAPRFDAILAQAMEEAPESAWQMALMAGDPDRARALAEAGGVPTEATALIDAWTGDPAAVRDVYARADASPLDPTLLSWATRLADRYGDSERAERYQRLAIFIVNDGGALPGTEIRVDRDGWFRHVPAGTLTGYAGHYLYRRPLPPDLLAPGLPRLVNIEAPDRDAVGEER